MQWTHRTAVRRLTLMLGHAFPLVLTVGGGLLYHLAMKSQSGAGGGTGPWAFFTLAYGVAFAASAALWRLGGGGGAASLGQLDRPTLVAAGLLGLAALGIEGGFYLAYRAGWALGQVSVISGATMNVLLAVAGVALAGEAMSATRALGLVVCLTGVALVVHGR